MSAQQQRIIDSNNNTGKTLKAALKNCMFLWNGCNWRLNITILKSLIRFRVCTSPGHMHRAFRCDGHTEWWQTNARAVVLRCSVWARSVRTREEAQWRRERQKMCYTRKAAWASEREALHLIKGDETQRQVTQQFWVLYNIKHAIFRTFRTKTSNRLLIYCHTFF